MDSIQPREAGRWCKRPRRSTLRQADSRAPLAGGENPAAANRRPLQRREKGPLNTIQSTPITIMPASTVSV